MSVEVNCTEVRLTAAGAADRAKGLVGFVTLTLNDLLILDGIGLRHSTRGELVLMFPERMDRHGRKHALVRPIDDAARRVITLAVLAALGLQGQGAP